MPAMLVLSKSEQAMRFVENEHERLELLDFAGLLKLVDHVDLHADAGGDILKVRVAGSDLVRSMEMSEILPREMHRVETDILAILNGADIRVAQRLSYKIFEYRWAVYGADFVDEDNRRWCCAIRPSDNPWDDEAIIWAEGYPSQALAYVGAYCEALAAEALKDDPREKLEAFANAVRRGDLADPCALASMLPLALRPYAEMVERVLAEPDLPSALALQSLLLGDRWKIHGLIQGDRPSEWSSTLMPTRLDMGRRARSGWCDDAGVAVMICVLKARLVDIELTREPGLRINLWTPASDLMPSARLN
jgi:hypothetical protein